MGLIREDERVGSLTKLEGATLVLSTAAVLIDLAMLAMLFYSLEESKGSGFSCCALSDDCSTVAIAKTQNGAADIVSDNGFCKPKFDDFCVAPSDFRHCMGNRSLTVDLTERHVYDNLTEFLCRPDARLQDGWDTSLRSRYLKQNDFNRALVSLKAFLLVMASILLALEFSVAEKFESTYATVAFNIASFGTMIGSALLSILIYVLRRGFVVSDCDADTVCGEDAVPGVADLQTSTGKANECEAVCDFATDSCNLIMLHVFPGSERGRNASLVSVFISILTFFCLVFNCVMYKKAKNEQVVRIEQHRKAQEAEEGKQRQPMEEGEVQPRPRPARYESTEEEDDPSFTESDSAPPSMRPRGSAATPHPRKSKSRGHLTLIHNHPLIAKTMSSHFGCDICSMHYQSGMQASVCEEGCGFVACVGCSAS